MVMLTLAVVGICALTWTLTRDPMAPTAVQSARAATSTGQPDAPTPIEQSTPLTASGPVDDTGHTGEDQRPKRKAKTLLANILLRDFFAEVGVATRDVSLLRRLFNDPGSATFDALIARSQRGDPQALVLLNTLSKELCPGFLNITERPGWKEDASAHFETQAYEFERLLEPDDVQSFHMVTGAFLNMAEDLSTQCKRGAEAMTAASAQLPQLADSGDTFALMALARNSNRHRESLIAVLHELPDDQLVTASDVVGRTANGCDAFEVRLAVLRERAATSPAVSTALGRLFLSSCMEEPAGREESLTHWRNGAYMGNSQSADAYLLELSKHDPNEQRIEAFAIKSFFARLNRLGCMGGNYFDILKQQGDERALTRGLHLSPYENDVALARAQTIWDNYGRTAMAHHHCAE